MLVGYQPIKISSFTCKRKHLNYEFCRHWALCFYLLTVGIFSSLFNFYCYRSNISEEKQSHAFKAPIKLWCWNVIVSKTSFQDLKNNWLNCQDSVSILAPGEVAPNLDRKYFFHLGDTSCKICAKNLMSGAKYLACTDKYIWYEDEKLIFKLNICQSCFLASLPDTFWSVCFISAGGGRGELR